MAAMVHVCPVKLPVSRVQQHAHSIVGADEVQLAVSVHIPQRHRPGHHVLMVCRV
jgi:hypothetical protein